MFEPEDVKRFRRTLADMFDVKVDSSTGEIQASLDGLDPEAFAEALALLKWASQVLAPAAVDELRRQGYSWADVARPIGISRATAQERFGRVPARRRAAAGS